MRAYVLDKSKKTPTLTERPDPRPGPGEVLVRTTAVTFHPVDHETILGKNSMMLPMKRPFVPGVDFAGEVLGLGEGASGFEVGQPVYGYRGLASMGTFAEQLCVPTGELAAAPAGMEPTSQVTLPLPALCALQALDDAELTSAGRVLVHGGAGGVGSVAVQIFAARGHHVIATASAKDEALVHELGAAEVIDYRATRFEEVVREVDLVFDTVGKDTLTRSFSVVRAGGAVASLAAMPAAATLRDAGLSVPGPLAALLPLMSWSVRRRAAAAKARLLPQVTVPSGARLAETTKIADARGLRTRLDRIFDFFALPEAYAHFASGASRGRVVVTVGEA